MQNELGIGVQAKSLWWPCDFNLTKFASALRLRWLWHEWSDEVKPWVGLGTPQGFDLFAAATKVTIGNERKALFGRPLGLMEKGQRCPSYF
jgi:hypothetical protein